MESQQLPICQYCGTQIKERVALCSSCRTPHHPDCFRENGSCTTYGCGARSFIEGPFELLHQPDAEKDYPIVVLGTSLVANPVSAASNPLAPFGKSVDGGSRFIAGFIDLSILGLLLALFNEYISPFVVDDHNIRMYILICWWLGRDCFLGGRGIGKRLLGIHIVSDDGKPAKDRALTLRNLPFVLLPITLLAVGSFPPQSMIQVFILALAAIFNFLEFLFVLGLFGKRRRLGDRLAGTNICYRIHQNGDK